MRRSQERGALGSWIDRLAQKRGITPDEVLRRLNGVGGEVDPTPAGEDRPAYELVEELRGRRKKLVGQLSYRTGEKHSEINARINKLTAAGRSVRDATVEELRAGNGLLEDLVAQAQRPAGQGTLAG